MGLGLLRRVGVVAGEDDWAEVVVAVAAMVRDDEVTEQLLQRFVSAVLI